jgi:hypothetical protein
MPAIGTFLRSSFAPALKTPLMGTETLNIRDEIVEEVRANRQVYAAQFNFDLRAIFEDLEKKEEAHPERLTKLRPVPRKTPITSGQ